MISGRDGSQTLSDSPPLRATDRESVRSSINHGDQGRSDVQNQITPRAWVEGWESPPVTSAESGFASERPGGGCASTSCGFGWAAYISLPTFFISLLLRTTSAGSAAAIY